MTDWHRRRLGLSAGLAETVVRAGASVASSGVPEAAGYPNTYQGFNLALLHIRDPRIGVIGLLFGSGGNGSSTSQWDARADGVTNPPPSCTSNGVSSGQAGFQEYVTLQNSGTADALAGLPNPTRADAWCPQRAPTTAASAMQVSEPGVTARTVTRTEDTVTGRARTVLCTSRRLTSNVACWLVPSEKS